MSVVSGACVDCLRRSSLIGHLAPRIAGLLGSPAPRTCGLLGLSAEDLIAAVVSEPSRARAWSYLESFDPDAISDQLDESGIEAACRHSDAYPDVLASTADAPPVLWVLGGLERFEAAWRSPSATIVGTRKPSPYGREVAYRLGRDLGGAGVTVVSGLALGIDAASHRGALAGGGTAVAVMANGPDVPYPRTNASLWREVAEAGVVISELPPGQRPYRWSFPARNRIMAAAAGITVVVEAADPSGSLITAEFAKDLGRVVAAVPGHVTAAGAAGSNGLLRDGAAVIRGAQDVLDELLDALPALELPAIREPAAASPLAELDGSAQRVLEAVESEEEGIEAIGRRARLAASEVRRALARLEGRGLVLRDPLGRYLRRAGG